MIALVLLLVYPWQGEPLSARIPAPPGYRRVAVAADSFGAWLRDVPLEPRGTKVHLFDGSEKARQDVHEAVLAVDVGKRDLQQCADAVMRLWSEYRYAHHQPIVFHPDAHETLRFDAGDRATFTRWLVKVFADAGSASLQAELPRATGRLEPGDVLIQGGHPGHAVIVLDVVENDAGDRKALIAQSYMPAQQIHVLKNLATGTPWFDESALDRGGIATPEWRPFVRSDVRRFSRGS